MNRDELIAKARKLSGAATQGPWNWANWGDVGDLDDVLEANRPAQDDADRRVWGETVSIKIAKDEDHDLSEADRSFLAESRTLLPALADLAEREGRRADEAEAKLTTARRNCLVWFDNPNGAWGYECAGCSGQFTKGEGAGKPPLRERAMLELKHDDDCPFKEQP